MQKSEVVFKLRGRYLEIFFCQNYCTACRGCLYLRSRKRKEVLKGNFSFRKTIRAGCSSARLECTSGGREAGGSNPLIPTKVFEGHSARAEWLSKALSSPHLRKGAAHPLIMEKHLAYLSGLYHTLLVMQRIRKGVAMKKPKAAGCGLQKL